ncbi:dTDP-4-dehydrorhamnose reductase [Halopseudomonas pachastrellae]|uniref:dTDP-4-dehydrorhamnose reductase n=1 Tax=Halopseudomonas pachastrellae TaxID=254161 RepID=UPI003D7EFE5C
MRVMVTGANGQLGRELRRSAPGGVDFIGLTSEQLDITDAAAVEHAVERYQPRLIINAAAYTAVDRAESDLAAASAVNAKGAENLALGAERAGIALFHVSTDYVFNGRSTRPYDEQSATDPQTAYGRSKLQGELAVAGLCSQHVILRTSWVFSSHGANFVKTMLRLARERDQLRVVADQMGGPTSARSIASALWKLAAVYQQQGDFRGGLLHFSGAPVVSWYEFATQIVAVASELQLIDAAPDIQAITSAEFPTPAPRPAFSALDCSHIMSRFGIAQPDWRADLKVVLAELADAHSVSSQ